MKEVIKFLWCLFPVTVAIYIILAFQTKAPQVILSNINPELIVFLILGLVSVVCGVAIAKTILNKNANESRIAYFLKIEINYSYESIYYKTIYKAYLIALSFVETSGVFGLCGYIITGNIIFYIIMNLLFAIGWILCRPNVNAEIIDKWNSNKIA